MKVDVHFYDGGYCTHPEFIAVNGGSHHSVNFAALCAVIIHPILGPILFDTGYSENFFKATKKMPYKIYALVTPVFVNKEDKISEKIGKLKLKSSDFKYIILSHFHADHIGAVLDFNQSTFVYTENSYAWVKNTSGIRALKKAFLPDLLPHDFEKRSMVVDSNRLLKSHFLSQYFEIVYDIFLDGSIIGVELPGHAQGQMGIYFETEKQKFFLIADACYVSETFKDLKYPNAITGIINEDTEVYKETVQKIHRLYKEHADIEIVPSHCSQQFKKYVKDCKWH